MQIEKRRKMNVERMKSRAIALIVLLMVVTVSCNREGCTDPNAENYDPKAKTDDGSCEIEPDLPDHKSGTISSNETWTSDIVYTITGKVVVESGVTITIEPGTIIKCSEGTGTLASGLVVAQGGKINAVGTATQPIIFTSVLDNIQLGQLTGTNLDENDQGLWGGILVLGYAPISAADGDAISQIEGIPVSDSYGAFGGNDPADNSGTMAYVSIRHGGALIGAGNEINGLTLGGVGTGTSISNIEVVANLDDGIEFFGGTVNASNLLVGFQGDDGIDVDMNYSGTVSNFIVVNGSNSDKGLEIDGPEGVTYTNGLFTLNNGSVYSLVGAETFGDFKSKAQGTINNVQFGGAQIRASYQNNCMDSKEDAFTHLTDLVPTLIFTSSNFTSVQVTTSSTNDAGTSDCSTAADQSAAEAAVTSGGATGMSTSSFESWTWAGINNKL